MVYEQIESATQSMYVSVLSNTAIGDRKSWTPKSSSLFLLRIIGLLIPSRASCISCTAADLPLPCVPSMSSKGLVGMRSGNASANSHTIIALRCRSGVMPDRPVGAKLRLVSVSSKTPWGAMSGVQPTPPSSSAKNTPSVPLSTSVGVPPSICQVWPL